MKLRVKEIGYEQGALAHAARVADLADWLNLTHWPSGTCRVASAARQCRPGADAKAHTCAKVSTKRDVTSVTRFPNLEMMSERAPSYDPYGYNDAYYDSGSCYVVQRRVHTRHGWRLQ